MGISDLIVLILSILLAVIIFIVIGRTGEQFHDKSIDIKEGMNEDKVLEIMGKDPLSVETLKDNKYAWIYEYKLYKGWGVRVTIIQIIFNESKLVHLVNRDYRYDKSNKID